NKNIEKYGFFSKKKRDDVRRAVGMRVYNSSL